MNNSSFAVLTAWLLAVLDGLAAGMLFCVRLGCFFLWWFITLRPHSDTELSWAALPSSLSVEMIVHAFHNFLTERVVNNTDSSTRIISIQLESRTRVFYRAWDFITVWGVFLVFFIQRPKWFLALSTHGAFAVFAGLVIADSAIRSIRPFVFFKSNSLSVAKTSTISYNTRWLSGILKGSFSVCFISFAWGCLWLLLDRAFHFQSRLFLTRQFAGELFHMFEIVFPFAAAIMCFRIVAPRLSMFADKLADLLVSPWKFFKETCILATSFLFLVVALFFAAQCNPPHAETHTQFEKHSGIGQRIYMP